MRDCIARTFEWLLRLLFPAPGRHRAPHMSGAAPSQDTPTRPLPRVRRVSERAPLNGEDIAAVRPYVAAHERLVELRRQGYRRALLVCAHHDMAVIK